MIAKMKVLIVKEGMAGMMGTLMGIVGGRVKGP